MPVHASPTYLAAEAVKDLFWSADVRHDGALSLTAIQRDLAGQGFAAEAVSDGLAYLTREGIVRDSQHGPFMVLTQHGEEAIYGRGTGPRS